MIVCTMISTPDLPDGAICYHTMIAECVCVLTVVVSGL